MFITETHRLNGRTTWIDLSLVEQDRTPRWAIEVGIRCHLAGMSLREVSTFLESFGINRSHVAIHNWVHKADLQPISTVSEDQLTVNEKMIRLHGQKFWLYGGVDPYTNKILHVSLYRSADKQTTQWFLTKIHRRYQLNGVEFLVDDADYLCPVLAEDGYRFRVICHGYWNAIERIFWDIERQTSSFAIVSVVSRLRQLKTGLKPSQSTTIHDKVNTILFMQNSVREARPARERRRNPRRKRIIEIISKVNDKSEKITVESCIHRA